MLGSLIRIIRPVRLIKRKGLVSGLFGGSSGWLALGGTVWFFGKVREVLGFGEPETVVVKEVKPGERIVLAHAPNKAQTRNKAQTPNEALASNKASRRRARRR